MATSVPMGIVTLKAEGAYSADKLYKKGMWVTSSGSSYAYINPTPAAGVPLTDTSHWQQIASMGGQDLVDAAVAARDAAKGYKDAAAASAAQLAAGVASPADTYANLAALIAANPDHAKIYITLDDGNWNYWNGSAFVAGGVYQAASVVGEIASISSQLAEIENRFVLGKNKFLGAWEQGAIAADGSFIVSANHIRTNKFDIDPETTYTISYVGNPGGTSATYIMPYDQNDAKLTTIGHFLANPYTFTTPAGCAKIALMQYKDTAITPQDAPTNVQIELGSSATGYEPPTSVLAEERVPSGIIDTFAADHPIVDVPLKSTRNVFTKWSRGALSNDGGYESVPTSKMNAATEEYKPVVQGKQYSFSWDKKAGLFLYIFQYDVNKAFMSMPLNAYNMSTNGSVTMSFHENARYIRLELYAEPAGSTWEDILPSNFQMEEGWKPTVYVKQTAIDTDQIDVNEISERMVDAGYLDAVNILIPDYYFAAGYLSNKISQIEALLHSCAANGDAFFFITDIHWSLNAKKSPLLIKYLKQHLNIPRLFDGGDASEGNNVVTPMLIDAMGSDKVYSVDGNHDYMSSASFSKVFYQRRMMSEDAVYGSDDRNYYYVDNVQQKIRYIVLAAYGEYEDGASAAQDMYANDPNQLTWFASTALNVEAGWTIIVISHTMMCMNMAETAFYVEPTGAQAYIDVIENYAGNGEIACVILGHAHRDRMYTLSNGVPLVITTCDKNTIWSDGTYDDLNVDRTSGTINEQAFDVVVLDKTLKKLTFVRIGAPALDGVGNVAGSPVEYREVTYGTP